MKNDSKQRAELHLAHTKEIDVEMGATQVALPYSIPDCDCGADHPFAHFVQVVLTPDEANVLRAIKTYFGHHDRTPFEHMAYGFLDKLCTAIRVSGLEGLVPPQEDRTTVSPETRGGSRDWTALSAHSPQPSASGLSANVPIAPAHTPLPWRVDPNYPGDIQSAFGGLYT